MKPRSSTRPAETLDQDIAPLLIEALRTGQSVRFRAEGRSMEPFLYAGDLVVVQPFRREEKAAAPRPGDVLCYERKPGVLRLHRLSRILPTPEGPIRLRVRGDAPGQPAETILLDSVLGVLTFFERDGRLHRAQHPLWRWIGLWWPRLRPRLTRLPRRRFRAHRHVEPSSALAIVTDALRDSLRGRSDAPATPIIQTAVDPRVLVTLARRHGVLALCASELIWRVPDAEKAVRDMVRALVLEGETGRRYVAEALQALAESGIRPLIVKGPALGALLYGDHAVRLYDDVDLLLAGIDREHASVILEERGWVDSRNSPALARRHLLRTTEDLAFRNPGCEVGIDIVHPGGLLREAAPRTSSCAFRLFGATAYAPSTVEHFLYCVAHGGKHGWTRLIWLADVDGLIASFTDADWGLVLTQARERHLTRLLALACGLAGSVLGTPYPPEALGCWKENPWLEEKIRTCLDAQLTDARHVETWRWWVGLLDTPGQRMRFLLTWFIQPTGADLRTCLLPFWAHAVYHILRPLRLLLRVVFRLGPPPLTWESEPRTQV